MICFSAQNARRTARNASLTGGMALMLMTSATAWGQGAQTEGLHGMVGAGVAVLPGYEGSDDYRVLPLPIVDLSYGRYFLNMVDGLGVQLIGTDQIKVGAGAVFAPGRRSKDSPEGVGKVKDTVGGRVFVRYAPVDEILLSAAVTKAFGGNDGTWADFSLGYRFQPSDRLFLLPAISTTWANDKYMDRMFGISELQSVRSGLPMFEAESGFKSVSMSLTGSYALSPSWHLSATGKLARYLGDTADSPLNEQKTQPSFIVGVAYRF